MKKKERNGAGRERELQTQRLKWKQNLMEIASGTVRSRGRLRHGKNTNMNLALALFQKNSYKSEGK